MKIPHLLFLLLSVTTSFAKEAVYNLTIAEQHVDITGKPVHAMTINGGIPGPTLRFREGDVAVIHVHNKMKHATSIHWHGMLLPPEMDGVPFVSFPPIEAGATFTYRFPIRQTGTYWYHSHTHLQEQLGVYGSIVIDPQSGREHAREHVVVLSDWTNRNPQEVLRTLRRGSEIFGVEKRTAQSVLGAAKTGTLVDFFQREGMRMPPMDLSDVSYDAFLTNGRPESSLSAKAGQTIRLRVINAAAGSYFHMNWAGGPLTVIAADGQRVEPLKMKEPLLIAIAETYDVLVTVPAAGCYEFRSTAHDGSGKTSLWIGSGERHFAKDVPKPFVYESMMGFDLKHLLALTPQGTMGMSDRMVESGAFDKPGMHMGGMDHGGMNHGGGGMDHGSMKMDGMKHQAMAMEGMDHGSHPDMEEADHSKMDHGGGKDDRPMDAAATGEGPAKKSGEGGMDMKPMDHGSAGGMATGGMQGMKHNPPVWYDFLLREDAARAPMLMSDGMAPERPFSPYKKLRSLKKTALPDRAPRRVFRLTLDGEMGRYVWMLNQASAVPRRRPVHQGGRSRPVHHDQPHHDASPDAPARPLFPGDQRSGRPFTSEAHGERGADVHDGD